MNLPNTLSRSTHSEKSHTETNDQSTATPPTDKSTQRVIRQLIEALLFEGIVEYRYQQPYFFFNIGNTQYRAKGEVSAFNRIRLNATSIQSHSPEDENHYLPAQLNQVANNLPTSASIKEQLLKELQQTVKLCQWNDKYLSNALCRRHLDYQELESAIIEGHPYHPCFKARTGFTIKDHIDYGPESGNLFQLHWVAVHRSFIKSSVTPFLKYDTRRKEQNNLSQFINDDSIFWQTELGLEHWSVLKGRLLEKGGNWQNYSLLPLHPWQWTTVADKMTHAMEQAYLIDLETAGDLYQASISVRTLMNWSHPDKANIKLPLNIINSASLRTLENHSVCTAPVLSQWLQNIIQQDIFFQQEAPLAILPEYAGIRLQQNTTAEKESANQCDDWVALLEDQLGVIFRESLEKNHSGSSALPFVALTSIENDKKPFIHPWIEKYGCEKWMMQLVKTTVIPVWHLLVHHGLGVETHAQNMIIMHQDGWPNKIILRDFHESLEYVENYLKKPELLPDFKVLESCYSQGKPNQYYWMDNLEALRELFVDTLFVYNLSDLSILMKNYYQYSEKDFWQLIHQQLQAYTDNGYTAKNRINKINLYQPRIQTESLIRKKLHEKSDVEFHHEVTNILSSREDKVKIQTKQDKRC